MFGKPSLFGHLNTSFYFYSMSTEGISQLLLLTSIPAFFLLLSELHSQLLGGGLAGTEELLLMYLQHLQP